MRGHPRHPAPRLHGQRPHDDRPGRGEVVAELGDERVELVGGRQPGCRRCAARNISANETINRWYQSSTMSMPACDIALTSTSPTESSIAGRRRPIVGSRSRERHRRSRIVAQLAPRRVGGLALPAQPVDLLDGDGAARADDRRRLAQHGERVGHVDQDEPDVGEVERAAWQLRGDGVAELEADVGQLGARAGGVVEHVDVAVDADDLAGRADERRTAGAGCRPDRTRCRRRATGRDVESSSSQPASSSISAAWATRRRRSPWLSPSMYSGRSVVLLHCAPCRQSTQAGTGKSWRTPEDRVEVSVGVANGLLLALLAAARPVRLEA